MAPSYRVRRIRPDEGDVFRTIRLRALAEDPKAFGAALGAEEAFESEAWTARAAEASGGANTAVFFAEFENRIEAMVGVYANDCGCTTLWGMWVAPGLRGAGVATLLVDAIEVWALEHSFDSVELCYLGGNDAAGRLYSRLGYVPSEQPGHSTAPGFGPEVSLKKRLPAPAEPVSAPD